MRATATTDTSIAYITRKSHERRAYSYNTTTLGRVQLLRCAVEAQSSNFLVRPPILEKVVRRVNHFLHFSSALFLDAQYLSVDRPYTRHRFISFQFVHQLAPHGGYVIIHQFTAVTCHVQLKDRKHDGCEVGEMWFRYFPHNLLYGQVTELHLFYVSVIKNIQFN